MTGYFLKERKEVSDGPVDKIRLLDFVRITNLEQHINQQNHLLDQLQWSLEDLLHDNSHSIRGPLAQIMGLAYLLDKITEEGERQQMILHLKQAAQLLDLHVHEMNKTLDTMACDLRIRTKPEKGPIVRAHQ